MNEYTIKNAAYLAGFVEGYLAIRFYSILLLFPQIPEKDIAKILNWPLSVLHDFLNDTSPQIRQIQLHDAVISITQNKQRYMDKFHSLCRQYHMFPKPASPLELSFIEAATQILLYDIPESHFTITTDSLKPDDLSAGKSDIWGRRTGLYYKYDIDPENCSMLEHDFVQAALLEKTCNVKLRFQYKASAMTGDVLPDQPLTL